jgi:hypothetical protein
MLMLTALSGFGAGGDAPKALVLIDRTTGTNIGNATNGGGLAAAFDGTTSQAFGAGAGSSGSVASIWVGKTLTGPKVFGQAIVYGSNDRGFVTGGGTPAMTINIRGKNGAAPASATDGTIVGTVSAFNDTTNESAGRTAASTDLVATWDHLFAEIAQGGAAAGMYCAEVEFWEWA